jgi:hypothetical protein
LRFNEGQPPFQRVRAPLEAERHEEPGDRTYGNGDRKED